VLQSVAGRDFSASWLTTQQHHGKAISMLINSNINSDYNGIVFMDG